MELLDLRLLDDIGRFKVSIKREVIRHEEVHQCQEFCETM